MIRADFHMHTNFSTDSATKPEEMIEGAIARGLQIICITDHYDFLYSADEQEFTFDVEKYFVYLRRLQEEYKEKIEIRIGIELGIQPDLGEFYHEFVKKHEFDFVIGSVHIVEKTDPAVSDFFERYGDERGYRVAFEQMLASVKAVKDFDVLGHIDYMVRYGKEKQAKYSYEKYADIFDEILKTIIENGKGIELNMAGLKYGLGFAHPHPQVLSRYRELGGETITVGADGHVPEHIAYDFHKAKDILEASGFKYYTEFKNRVPYFVKL